MGILGRLPLPSNNENYGESSDGGNSYYAYATSDSGVCDAALSRVLGTESTKTDALAEVGSEGDLISVVNGGSEFGLFAVTYSGARLSSPLVRGLLPSPSDSAIDSPKAFDDMAALRGVCIPVDSAAGYFYGSDQDNIFSRSVDDKTPVDECATGRGVEPIGAQCPASSNYFIHEVVTSADRSGMFASSDMQGSSGSKGIGASVVDLDLLFDNVVKHTSMDSRPADVEQASNRSQLDTATTALVVVAHAYDVIQSMAAKISQKTATLAIFIVTLLLWLMRPSMATSNIGAVSLPKLAVDTSLNVTDPSRVARVVGNIHITENLLGVGSSGTLVYFGFTSELGIMRPAAIKQMLKSNYSHAIKEIANLKKIDAHDNIVNYYMCEQNDNFVFLALQLCRMNLKDFVVRLERRLPPAVLRLRLCPAHADGVRASLLQAAEAVEFLHRRGVLHRDIKPHNILMEEVQSKPHAHIGSCVMFGASDIDINDIADMSMFKMRVSDFGLSKDVRAEELSFGSLSLDGKSLSGAVEEQKNSDKYLSRPPGSTRQWDAVGTIGWQAPELIKRRMRKLAGPLGEDASQEDDGDQLRLTSKVDIFALGCVLHFTLVPGCHPFGHWRDREDNIVRDTSDLSLLARTPDAFDLVSSMIHRDPQLRPTAREICFHPFFWNSQKRLDFWEALYCRLRKEGAKSRLIRELEVYADPVVHRHDTLLSDLDKQRGCFGWGAVLDVAFQREIDNPPHGIVYDVTSVYSCIRFIRHKKSHFDELDGRIRTLLSLPQGYMRYFESRLPRLFLYTVWFAVNYLANEKEFQKFDLQVMSRATYFSSVAPPVVITKDVPTPFLVLKADPDMKSINNGPCINERQLPSCVLRTLQNADNNADEENSGIRRRGYYEWSLDAMSKVNKMASEVEKSVTILPSRGEQWARGVVVDAFSSESAKERERTGPIQDRVMSLLYSNIFIPPRVNRPLHIKKALENERYRTDLCREWEESGKDQFCIGRSSRDDIDGLHAKYQPGSKHQHCKFRRGQKQCDYAHGRIELRAKGMQRITSGFSNVGRYVSGDIVDAWGHCDHFK